ncbi:endonuclease/exonuclease/phosphatase family protein [Rhizoctonia solani 123E]|uniref:Endonuclease/exonuclease/phosphatase family protein n=1 Tax=Rhizoctonia solani 123E TaxID=1423351 RepID=A0A074RE35_9AGAM|nr:endonuclease/exonuclease/phosphatase family protein [Rhizoctonia solani 123E]
MLWRSISFLAALLLCSAAPTNITEHAFATSGTFNVLSLSVNGLPDVLDPLGASGAEKNLNTKYMGIALSHYDYGVVNVQKDFNYHTMLYQHDNHPFRTKFSGGVLHGSGLNTLSKYSWIDFSRTRWEWCSNESRSEYNCMLHKGFTFMRVRINEGVYIDMINLHADSGIKPGDEEARCWNIPQVSEYISANSVGNAVIVFGNTNSRYTRSKDNLDLFISQNSLTDAWVQANKGKVPAVGTDAIVCPKEVPSNISCEVVDKVFYRGSPAINLDSLGFFYDTSRFLSPKGKMLTDHHPVRVDFEYTLRNGLRQSDLYGGPHATWFNDLPSVHPLSKLAFIVLCGASRLDSLVLKLESGEIFTHGGSGGDCYLLLLRPKEYITSVKLCWGKKRAHTRIFYARASTNTGRPIRAGTTTNYCAIANAPAGYGVVGAYGKAGDEMDLLGFIYAQQCVVGKLCN